MTEGEYVGYNGETRAIVPEHMSIRLNWEIKILKVLSAKEKDNKYIIKLFSYWRNKETNEVAVISEIYNTNLRNFIMKAEKLRITAIKKWCYHLLKGLQFIHELEKPVVHRNLKCSSIFIKGNGDLKIGHLFHAVFAEASKIFFLRFSLSDT